MKKELQMPNGDKDYEGSFLHKHRAMLVMGGVVVALVLAVIVYNRTGQQSTDLAGRATPQAGAGGTLAVGALPVT